MTSSEEQMTIDQANDVLSHYDRLTENSLIRVLKNNPSLDPSSLLIEIEFLKKEVAALKQISYSKKETSLETFVRSLRWDNLLDIAKTVDPKKLTTYNVFKGFGEPQEWKLVTLSHGTWTSNNKGVSYQAWDGEKIVSMILWGDKQFELQPGAIYTFTISEASIGSHEDKLYNNARLLFERPIFEESLLFLKDEAEPIKETPLLPSKK